MDVDRDDIPSLDYGSIKIDVRQNVLDRLTKQSNLVTIGGHEYQIIQKIITAYIKAYDKEAEEQDRNIYMSYIHSPLFYSTLLNHEEFLSRPGQQNLVIPSMLAMLRQIVKSI